MYIWKTKKPRAKNRRKSIRVKAKLARKNHKRKLRVSGRKW